MKLFKVFFCVIFLFELSFFSFCIDSFAQVEFYIVSSNELKFLDDAGNKVIIPVQIRAQKNKIKTYKDKEGVCFTYMEKGKRVITSDSWEVVLNPNSKEETYIKIEDWGGFVENTLHDGKLYTDMFNSKNDYDRLFLYYYLYGTCNHETLIMYYYDKMEKTLLPVGFQFSDGTIGFDKLIYSKESPELIKTPINFCPDCPQGMLYEAGYNAWEGEYNEIIWEFNENNHIFNIYRATTHQ